MSRRVVITGMGTVNCLSQTVKGYWEGLLAGRSGIGPIGLFDTTAFKVHFGGEVRDFHPETILDTRAAQPHKPRSRASNRECRPFPFLRFLYSFSFLLPCGNLPVLLNLRGYQDPLPGVRTLWYITRTGAAVAETRPTRSCGPA